MNRSEMSGCCGVQIIYDLNYTGGANFTPSDTLESSLTSHISASKSGNYGAVIASTIPSQVAAIEALRAKGFTELMTFKAPRHGNMITLWGRTTAEPKALAKPKAVDTITDVKPKVVRKRTPKAAR